MSLLLACSAAADEPLPTSICFAQLPPTDSVHVQLVLASCWGDSAFEFEVHGGPAPRVSAVRLAGVWSHESQQFVVERRGESREISLTPHELAGLDELLRYYRAGPGDGCSDQHIVSLSQVRGERILVSEHYIDNRCGDNELEGATSFWELLPRLKLPQ